MSRKQNLLPKTCVGHARLLKTTATTTTTHAHAVTTHNHSVHLGDGQNSLLPGLKTPALVENFCSRLNRPATNQILLRTAKTSRDCRKLRKTAWYQRIFASHQLSSSDAHIFTSSVCEVTFCAGHFRCSNLFKPLSQAPLHGTRVVRKQAIQRPASSRRKITITTPKPGGLIGCRALAVLQTCPFFQFLLAE